MSVAAAVPTKARVSAILFLVYGALVLAYAWLLGRGVDPVDAMAAGRATFRAIVIVVIAVGLLRGARWAWLAGLILPAFWAGIALLGLLATDVGGAGGGWTVLIALGILAAGWALLLSPEVRAAYGSP